MTTGGLTLTLTRTVNGLAVEKKVLGVLRVADFGIAGDKIPLSTFTQKGGVLVGTASGAVAEMSPLGTAGAIMTEDPTEPKGWIAQLPATSSQTTAGTDATLVVSPDGLAGSDFGKRVISVQVSDPGGDAITTGDGKAIIRIPAILNGYNLVAVAAHVTTVSSSGTPTVQLRNITDSCDMLSTRITIDANEKDSATAAAAAVIDATHDDVATADEIAVDIDTAGTGAKGLIVEMTFQLP